MSRGSFDLAFTILHLSDLHRSLADPIGNEELISALVADRDRAATEDPPIAAPDAIIITGDLIQGAPLGLANYGTALDEQYAVAKEFLGLLAERFLGGDRSRLVIAPGNHDIDWNGAKAAMTPVDETDVPAGFSLGSCGATSDLRWSWEERRVYKIVDRSLYEQRLLRFEKLVAEFYEGADIVQRALYRLHTLAGGRIAAVAFNSCLGNDCFTLHGEIDESAIAGAHLELRELSPELSLAIWHHSIEGVPAATDYMDPATVAELIGKGFRLGLHGHQHRAAAANHYVHLPNEERMAVVSAGSLCADKFHLPVGVNRQYNLIELGDDLCSARVHVREMVIANTFAAAHRAEFGLDTYIELTWEPPLALSAGREAVDETRLLKAERALNEQRFADVGLLLEGTSTEPGSYSRRLLRTALEALQDWAGLAGLLADADSVDELFAATKALAEVGDCDQAERFLGDHLQEFDLRKTDVADLRSFITAKRALQ
jgi:predicted MPP superfamily phosphohydrolase